jgi:phosphoribosyl-ATP pyrophosphohydrolase
MLKEDVLTRLAGVIEARKGADPQRSYVARLLSRGTDQILKKIGEEATETVMAAKDGDRVKIVAETADLWFHTLIMLSHFGLAPADVLAELERREGNPGLDEKAARDADHRTRDQAADGGARSPNDDRGSDPR